MKRWVAVGILLLAGGAALAAVWGGRTLRELDARVEARFQGRLFSVPSRVYSAPLVLYPGLDVERAGLEERLRRLRYRFVDGPSVLPGEVARLPERIRIGRRSFRYPHRVDPGGVTEVRIDGEGRIVGIRDAARPEAPLVEIEPEVIAEMHGAARADRRLVRLMQVPPVLVRAILAVEDQRFYEHAGIDFRRVAGAFLANLRAGRIVQGASTLTQQLVKNFYLTPERTFQRKIREAAMAMLLERRHTKEEILEAYLNEVYLGQRGSVAIHGVGEAAFHYFAKEIGEITLGEAALLAGLIKGPSLYSPYTHPDAARDRRDLVLGILVERGWISAAEQAGAVEEEIRVEASASDDNPAPYFVDHLRQDLARVYGEEILESEGLSVYTTLDPRLQRVASRAVERGLARIEASRPAPEPPQPDDPNGAEADPDLGVQGALIALAPRTGEILALVGGRDYGLTQFNRATQARRQPGSVFKPVVALAALSPRDGATPSHTLASALLDEPLEVDAPGGTWEPANYDGEFRGPVTLRQALEQSLNVPMARLGLEVGAPRIVETALRMGFGGPFEEVPSIALGVFEVTLMEAARAYAVLAAGGIRPTLRTYVEVMDAEGRILERKPLDFDRVFDPPAVHLVTSALQGAVDRGTGRGLRRLGFEGPVAGKTGTTSGYRDAWFIAYIPDLLVAVWVGYDDGRSLGLPGGAAALPIAGEFLLEAVGPAGRGDFDRPPTISLARPANGVAVPVVDRELFLPGTEPDAEGSKGLQRLFDWIRDRG